MLENIYNLALQQWPFIAVCVSLGVLGTIVTQRILTEQRAASSKCLTLYRDTIPTHPIVLGALIGLVWQDPAPYIEGLWASIAYFTLAGSLSLFVWTAAKYLAKDRLDIDLELPK